MVPALSEPPGQTNAMPVVTAVLGDITTQDVDAVVNAANKAMRGGGGVDGAIHRGGGPAILRDCIARFPEGLATGDAGWTTAGDLPARWVIHTVGPNYHAGERDRSLLEPCYRRALEVADELGARSVAFPLISTGVRGWPHADAIAAAIETIAAAETGVDEVRLVAFDEAMHKRTRAAVWVRCPPPVDTDSVGSLFEREPIQYSLRGDFYLWYELRAGFADTPLPHDCYDLRMLIMDTIEQIVGKHPASLESAPWHDPTGAIYVPEFDPGHGMSVGAVHVPWWVHTGLPILLDRYAARRKPSAFTAE